MRQLPGGSTAHPRTGAPSPAPPVTPLASVHVSPAGSLPVPTSKASAAALPDGRVVLVGGLVGGASTSNVLIGRPRHRFLHLTSLPHPLHDAAAVVRDGRVLHIGGGDATGSAAVNEIDPASGRIRRVATLPRPASDLGAVMIGTDVLVIGGFDDGAGTWLDTALTLAPARPRPRVLTRFAHGIRYAAVGALGGKVYVAGGTLPDGRDTRDVYELDPATGHIRILAPLAHPTAHAAFAPVDGRLVLVGGRIGTTGSTELRSFDPRTGRTRRIGRLPHELADPAVAPSGRGAWLVGGATTGDAATAAILALTP